MNRICRAPDYAESTVGVGVIPWWEAVVVVGPRHIQMASRKASRWRDGCVYKSSCRAMRLATAIMSSNAIICRHTIVLER